MEKILKMKDYTLIFSEPDLILYGFINKNSCDFMDQAEEFAKSFFSGDILSKEYMEEKDLTRVKHWLLGVLYHERKNSIPEILELTGYKSSGSTRKIIMKSGSLRSIREGTELAFQRRYGKGMSEVFRDSMRNKWDNIDKKTRDRISKSASEGLKKYWKEKKKIVISS